MDDAGIGRTVVVPPSWIGDDTDSLVAARCCTWGERANTRSGRRCVPIAREGGRAENSGSVNWAFVAPSCVSRTPYANRRAAEAPPPRRHPTPSFATAL